MTRSVPVAGGKRGSELEEALAWFMRVDGVPIPEREFHFKAPGHRNPYRFDFAWPDRLVAVEVDGGQWTGGRHQRPKGFEDDCVRSFEAAIAGWTVCRVTGDMIDDGRAVLLIKALLATRPPVILTAVAQSSSVARTSDDRS